MRSHARIDHGRVDDHRGGCRNRIRGLRARSVSLLRADHVVACPTETVDRRRAAKLRLENGRD